MATRSSTTSDHTTEQRGLFDSPGRSRAADEQLVLLALGDFQRRGKILIDRDLPLDRLRGALRRQIERAGTPEMADEKFAEILTDLGARVKSVPSFVAKHPFRVVVGEKLAQRALELLAEFESQVKSDRRKNPPSSNRNADI